MSLPERQSELVDTHRAVQDAELPDVLVGGWAVSAFQTRFTTDIDTVIPDTALNEYDTLLRDPGYEKQFEKDVSNEYEGRMIQYTKEVGENEIKFEALVDAMGCRQTDAEWSYRYLHEYSTIESLVGFDILLRVNAEESRAVGVSGLQSNHRTTSPFGHG